MYVLNYNSQPFSIGISLIYSIDSDKNILEIPLTRESVMEITLINDINYHFKSGIITVKDIGNKYAFNPIPNGNWFISVDIAYNILEDEDETKTFIKSLSEDNKKRKSVSFKKFLIKKVVPISQNENFSIIEYHFVDPKIQLFLKPVAFSSQSTDMDRVQILTGILSEGGFSEKLDTADNCGKTDLYITDNNSSMFTHCEYMLNKIYNKEKGFLFFYWDNVDEKIKFVWDKSILNDKNIKTEEINNFSFPADSTKKIRGHMVINDSYLYADNIYENSARTFIDSKFQEFDFIKSSVQIRKDLKFDYADIAELLAKNATGISTIMPIDNLKIGSAGTFTKNPGNYFNASEEDEFIKIIREAYIKNNLICIKVPGALWRNIGQKYTINYSSTTNSAKINGDWFCIKIIDEFKNAFYNQYIYLIRSSYDFSPDNIKALMDSET